MVCGPCACAGRCSHSPIRTYRSRPQQAEILSDTLLLFILIIVQQGGSVKFAQEVTCHGKYCRPLLATLLKQAVTTVPSLFDVANRRRLGALEIIGQSIHMNPTAALIVTVTVAINCGSDSYLNLVGLLRRPDVN